MSPLPRRVLVLLRGAPVGKGGASGHCAGAEGARQAEAVAGAGGVRTNLQARCNAQQRGNAAGAPAYALFSEFNRSGIAHASEAASLGLGLSGHPEILGLLRSESELEWDQEFRDVLDTAIEQNLRVAQLGVRGHYTIPIAQKARTNGVRRHDGIAVQD